MSDPRERAAAMRARGMGYSAIGRKLGVGHATVYRWLNPEYEARSRAVSRDWKERQRQACRGCGTRMSWDNDGDLCGECRHDATYGERNKRIVAAWNNGALAVEIAAVEGMQANAVLSLVDHWRRHGVYDVLRHTRAQREAWDYIERRWNVEGATTTELAAELGTSPANVGMMIRSMRLAGVDVARRRRVAA